MANKTKNKKSLDDVFKDVNSEFKEVIAGRNLLQNSPINNRISFSSPRMNYMTHGGLPRGRFHEFLGEENGGKTTTALDIVSNAQKLFTAEWEAGLYEGEGPQKVIYLDVETSLDLEWAKLLQVDVDYLYVIQPTIQTADTLFDILVDSLDTQEVGLIVIDSIGSLISAAEQEKDTGEASYAGISKPLTLFCKKAAPLCHRYNSTLIGINQLRDDMRNQFNRFHTPGGRAWRFYCSTRMAFSKGKFIDESGTELSQGVEDPAGNRVDVAIIKTKSYPPTRRIGSYTLNYSRGIDAISDLVDTGIKYGVIKYGGGGWTTFLDYETKEPLTEDNGDPIKVQGKNNVADFLFKDQFVLDFLKDQINKASSK